MTKEVKWLLSVIIICCVGFFFAAWSKAATPAATPSQKWPEQILIGSYPKVSASYPASIALSQLTTKYTPSRGILKEFAGGGPGLTALGKGLIDIFSTGQWDHLEAYYGRPGSLWAGKPQNIRLMNYYYPGPTNSIGVRPGEGIEKVEDLAGKRVLTNVKFIPWGQRAHDLILEFYGLKNKIKPLEITGFDQIADMMVDKRADAFIFSTEGAYAMKIKASVGLKWLPLSEKCVEYVVSKMEGFDKYRWAPYLLKMWGYPTDATVYCTAYCFSNTVRADLPDHVVYGILDALYADKHLDEVRNLAGYMHDVSLERACSGFWYPFHDGAVKYYKYRKVWTNEMEKHQKELLAKSRRQ